MLGLQKMVFFFFFFWKEGRKSVELLFTSFCLNRALCVNPPPHNETLSSENWLSGSLFRIIHHHGTASCIHGRFTSVTLRKKNKRPMIWRKGWHYLWSANNVLRTRWRSISLAPQGCWWQGDTPPNAAARRTTCLATWGSLKARHSVHFARQTLPFRRWGMLWEVSLMVSTDSKIN